MPAIINKKINWKETLLGVEIGEPLVINKPSIQDVQTARQWSSRLKKEGVITKVSLTGLTLTITKK